jgi:hypothetical protein
MKHAFTSFLFLTIGLVALANVTLLVVGALVVSQVIGD